KGGLAHSDLAVTVSPTHARELCTPDGGFGLHDTFIGMGDRLNGILNGIDPTLWNPETDPEITDHFSREDLSGKRRCKAAAQRYGAVPVARRVGGLSDSITDGVTGFLFDEYTPEALGQAVSRAVDGYADRPAWRKLVRAAMTQTFGWDRSAERYMALYARAL